jgi:hypothetical protein
MSSNDYHFITPWRVEGDVGEVSDILEDALALPRWWPAVYASVQELDAGEERGIGRVISLHTRGWLPYTLSWQFRMVESRAPFGFTLEASGDFAGTGIWRLEQEGGDVVVTYDWRIRADKPLLRRLSFLLRPVFSANHRWAMARGEESLRLELRRRRAATDAERATVPRPPPPSFWFRAEK